MPSTQGEIAMGQRWEWIMEVIFGGVIVFALEALEATVEESTRGRTAPIDLRVTFFVGACCLSFLLYDIGIYHLLTRRYPFQKRLASVGRFCLDIVMAACLFLIVVPVMHRDPERATLTVLLAATAWHLFAAGWHVLASIERDNSLPPMGRFLPHLAFPGAYWALIMTTFVASQGRRPAIWTEINQIECLITLACALLGAAIIRTVQMIDGEIALPRRKLRN